MCDGIEVVCVVMVGYVGLVGEGCVGGYDGVIDVGLCGLIEVGKYFVSGRVFGLEIGCRFGEFVVDEMIEGCVLVYESG